MPFESYKYNLYLPTHVKISPTELIRDLVNLQVPGIDVSLLPVAPRQIPYHSGYLYFELDNHSEMWLKLRKSPGLALHLGGNFPNVDLQLWAARN